ncbi:type IV pili methyl-accepting chemotaxis transducer N-terminal domain-containing protein, partial [Cronobacter sakazakii]|uniref:type IV pili methyl-accepting chemotaxis transducer N-terminal domain-containing protein n=1 Tax=Cronobacter sakazakii TaxID=28141 RepID=UPI003A8B8687
MLKRRFSPLTLANQLAIIVLLLAGLGMGGMALAGWLAQGVQGSAHAINKAGSLRMQSYRLLAAVPVGTTRTDMFNEMA